METRVVRTCKELCTDSWTPAGNPTDKDGAPTAKIDSLSEASGHAANIPSFNGGRVFADLASEPSIIITAPALGLGPLESSITL